MVRGKQTIFKYKTTKTSLHKTPAMLKLFLLLPLSIFCMSLPSPWLLAGIILAAITAFLLNFTPREQLTDLKPALFYALVMYALSIFSILFLHITKNYSPPSLPSSFLSFLFSLFFYLTPRPEFLRITLRLVLIIQLSAMLFRTTSSMEIREGLNSIERYIRKIFYRLPVFGKKISPQPRFTENISLFLCFIPEIFAIWTNINLAWKARGGRQGFRKIITLVFILITLSFEKASIKARALAAREN